MFRHPSQRRAKPSLARLGRCREQTAGTYGRKTMVKACSRPRTSYMLAANAEVVRKSLDLSSYRFDSGLEPHSLVSTRHDAIHTSTYSRARSYRHVTESAFQTV